MPMSPFDATFLWGETPETMRQQYAVQAPWNRKLRHPRLLSSPVQSWVTDEEVDLDYHLRRSALGQPGR